MLSNETLLNFKAFFSVALPGDEQYVILLDHIVGRRNEMDLAGHGVPAS